MEKKPVRGKFHLADHSLYEGEFNTIIYKGGTYNWNDDRKYMEQWLNGKQNKIGMYISADGKERKGEWKDSKRVKWLKGKEDCGDDNCPEL